MMTNISQNISDQFLMEKLMEIISAKKMMDFQSANPCQRSYNSDAIQQQQQRISSQSVNPGTLSWLDSTPVGPSSSLTAFDVGQWPAQPHRSVKRTQSATTRTALKSPDTVRTSQSVTDNLKSQHRGLGRTSSEPVPPRVKSPNDTASSQGETAESVADRYKTELCRTFQEYGKCKYGDKCQFAHGNSELRKMIRHPKYKTDRCKTYHSKGFCPYGPRCHFIHEDSDGTTSPAESSNLLVVEDKLHQGTELQDLMALLNLPRPTPCPSGVELFDRPYSMSSLFSSLPTCPPSFDVKCNNSLGSLDTNSPPSSVTDSLPPSPNTAMFDSINSARCDSLNSDISLSKIDMNDPTTQILLSNMLANRNAQTSSGYSNMAFTFQNPYFYSQNTCSNEFNYLQCNSVPVQCNSFSNIR